ncbi:MAG: hypothetical protein KGJ86_00030 [Chloroflexota bacterium]|nr:hypothetical protein [Chloroflexota bacterium]
MTCQPRRQRDVTIEIMALWHAADQMATGGDPGPLWIGDRPRIWSDLMAYADRLRVYLPEQ